MGNKNRGSNTHGHGSSKKRRGAGNRGGRGRAGLGKKALHKRVLAKKTGDHLGAQGFKRPQKMVEETTVINLRDLDQQIDEFVAQGYAEESDGEYTFDAEAAGYDKILGSGRLTKSINIKAPEFSDSARRKIEDNGNEVTETAESDENDASQEDAESEEESAEDASDEE